MRFYFHEMGGGGESFSYAERGGGHKKFGVIFMW